MFSRTSKANGSQEPVATPQKPAPPSLLSADLRVVGDITSDGEIHIDGRVDGDIRSKILLVGETAVIKGEIVADSVSIHGTVNGQIRAKSVHLAKSAHVNGDILHEALSIEKGAFLDGHCKRLEDKPAESRINLVKDAGPAAKLGEVRKTATN